MNERNKASQVHYIKRKAWFRETYNLADIRKVLKAYKAGRDSMPKEFQEIPDWEVEHLIVCKPREDIRRLATGKASNRIFYTFLLLLKQRGTRYS